MSGAAAFLILGLFMLLVVVAMMGAGRAITGPRRCRCRNCRRYR